MNKVLIIYLLFLNLLSFILCFIDKNKAIHHKRRISERCLLFFSFIGGTFGFYIGMFTFHHKTKHIKFLILEPIFIILWIFIIVIGGTI